MKKKLGIVFIVRDCATGLIACSSQTADKKKADDVKFAFIPKLVWSWASLHQVVKEQKRWEIS